MKLALPFAYAALISASGGPAPAAGPPKCDEVAQRAWYQRAVDTTDGEAAPQVAHPQWCWLENPAGLAVSRPARARRAVTADDPGTIDGAFRTQQPSMSPGALRSIAIHDDTFPAQD